MAATSEGNLVTPTTYVELPGLDCGLCGVATCVEFRERLAEAPELLKRCIHLDVRAKRSARLHVVDVPHASPAQPGTVPPATDGARHWVDSLGREFDFVLQHFPEDPGPREIIIPHNPMLTREMDIRVGETLIGRPLGMSCGCPVTHCGVAVNVELRTGVIVWCVTGPLRPRQEGFKDLGYYIAEGYEGMVTETRSELKIGMRYFFQPRMCMLQWRHSGLLNYLNRTPSGYQVRVEGLWIG